MRNFIGSMTVAKADKGYFITTGTFTEPAIREASGISSLVLVDGNGIVNWWQEFQIGPFLNLFPAEQPAYPPAPPPLPPTTILGFTVWQWITLVILGEAGLIVVLLLLSDIISRLMGS